jgi:transposase-like protein
MSFVRSKEIPPGSGNWYDYEVKCVREGSRVIQKHIRYIGKSGSGKGISGGHSPVATSKPDIILDIKPAIPRIACKYCGSDHTRKYGKYKDVQNYYCNNCHTKFIGTDALTHGRVSPSYIANAVNEYYSGMSFHEIENNIEAQTDNTISHTAVNKWVNKFTRKAIQHTQNLHPRVGNTWIADETYIQTDIKGTDPKGVVFWDIIDAKTRFLLASRITTTRNKGDAQALMELASKRAGKTPRVVVTDKLGAYIQGIEQAYGSDTIHEQGSPFHLENNTSLIERFHNSLKDRTKVMRDCRDKGTLKRFTDGWLVHYNYFRPHTALDGKTPAETAGLKADFHSWADVVGYQKSPIVQTLTPNTASME